MEMNKCFIFSNLTPLNLPQGETSGLEQLSTTLRCSPPLEGMGEVKIIKKIMWHYFLLMT